MSPVYDDAFAIKIEKVKKLTPEFWAKRMEFFGMYNQPAALYLQFMLNHAIHHRGQLTAYLRPMGAKVPNIYGGSFDEPMEFECRRVAAERQARSLPQRTQRRATEGTRRSYCPKIKRGVSRSFHPAHAASPSREG